MPNINLNSLPKLRDSISYIYFEHAIIEQEDLSLTAITENGRIRIPVAATTCVLLGPGTSITHAAIKTAAANGCMIVWCGEAANLFYASGIGETRKADNLLLQAKLCMDPSLHMDVVRKMYELRFPGINMAGMSLQQIRGMEGIRVRQIYKIAAMQNNVEWHGRDFSEDESRPDTINKMLSLSNSILYGVCHAAIVSLGLSPGLGFIHTGKQLSFVYDVADLYKANVTIPAAFEAVGKYKVNLSEKTRTLTRQYIRSVGVLRRIASDIFFCFGEKTESNPNDTLSGLIWNGEDEAVPGFKNYSGDL